MTQTERRRAWRALGVCADCGRDSGGANYCAHHRELRRAASARALERERRALAHPCARCGEVAYHGILCRPCFAAMYVAPRGSYPFSPREEQPTRDEADAALAALWTREPAWPPLALNDDYPIVIEPLVSLERWELP